MMPLVFVGDLPLSDSSTAPSERIRSPVESCPIWTCWPLVTLDPSPVIVSSPSPPAEQTDANPFRRDDRAFLDQRRASSHAANDELA